MSGTLSTGVPSVNRVSILMPFSSVVKRITLQVYSQNMRINS